MSDFNEMYEKALGKKASYGEVAFVFLIGFCIGVAVCTLGACDTPSPVPSPSPVGSVLPEPTPTSTPSPVPSRALTALVTSSANVADEYRPTAFLSLAQNETRGIWVRSLTDDCLPITKAVSAEAQFFKAPPMTFAKPSYIGAPPTGYDLLIPVERPCGAGLYFADVKGQGVLVIGNAVVTLFRNSFTLPAKPSMPLYVGLNPSYTGVLKMDGSVTVQGPLVLSTVQLMRAHRIEPFSQYVTNYPKVQGGNVVLDEWKESSASFRQLVLDGAIAPPCLVPPLQDTPSSAYLSAIQAGLASGTLPVGAWAYGWDEDQLAPPANALARINAIKSGASRLDVRATREEDPQFSAVDSFVPLIDWFKQPGHVQNPLKPYGLYTSCMAQGSCSGAVAKPSGAPMLVADASPVHALAFPVMAAYLGAKHALYYSAVEHFGVGLNYFSNGNGDGQLLYAGDKTVYPSVRLKLLREGMFMAEYLKAKPASFAGLIQSGKSFTHDYSAFQAARDAAGQ